MSEETTVTAGVQSTESPEANEVKTEQQETQQEESLLNGKVEELKEQEEPKPEEKQEEKPPEEVEYNDFTMPEGVTLDAGLLDKAKPLFKELGLSKDQAQRLVTLQAEAIGEINKQQINTWDNQIKQWRDDTVKELGSDYKEKLGKANKLIKDFDDESRSFALLLEDSGLANHPAVARFFLKVSGSMSEDTFHRGNSGSRTLTQEEKLAQIYPSMKDLKK